MHGFYALVRSVLPPLTTATKDAIDEAMASVLVGVPFERISPERVGAFADVVALRLWRTGALQERPSRHREA